MLYVTVVYATPTVGVHFAWIFDPPCPTRVGTGGGRSGTVIVAVVTCPPMVLTLITYVPGIRSDVKPGDAMRRDDLRGGGVDGKAGVGV